MNVTLHQIVGRFCDNRGRVHMKATNVDRVLLEGYQVGTIGRFKGAKFCPLAGCGLNHEECVQITEEIAKLRAKSGAFGPPDPDPARMPPADQVAQAIEEEYEEDEE